MINDIPLFPISWLHSQSYCEYQLFLEKFKKIQVEKTQEMIQGCLVHKQLEKEHLEKATEEMTVEEAIKRSEITGETFIIRELDTFSFKHGIYGKIDEVQIEPERIIIIDDKPNNYPYLSLKRQVWGYCLCFQDEMNIKKEIISVLRNRDSKNIFWQEPFNEESRNHIVDVVLKTHDLIKGIREAEATGNSAKCMKCRFNKVCDQSLV